MLDLLLGRPGLRAAGDPLDDRYYGYNWLTGSGGRTKTRAGVEVTEDIALTYSAVWCASRLLAEAKGGLPLFAYKRVKSDGREHATELGIYDLLHTSPNGIMGAKVFREGRTLHQVNWGNGFAEIEFDRPGDYSSEIVAQHPLHPCRVRPTPETAVDKYGQTLYDEFPYQVLNDDKRWVPMRRQEILHIPGALSEDGVWGKGVISHHREQIGYGMSVHRHGASYFGAGAKPPAVLNLPGMSNKETRRQFRQEWKEVHGTADSVEVVILPMEGKYAPISMSNEDSQFLGTMAFNVGEVARMYMVPVYMLEEYAKASSYNTVEQRGMQFVVFSLMPWIAKDEEQCNLKLLTRKQRQQGYFIEYEVKGLLRGDQKTRYASYQVGILNGFLTINQVCRLENMPTIGPEGDINYLPMNYTTAERMMKGMPSPSEEQKQKERLAARAGTPKDESNKAFLEWLPKIIEAARGQEPQLSQARTITSPEAGAQICALPNPHTSMDKGGSLATAAVLSCHSDNLDQTTEKQANSGAENEVLTRSIAASANVVMENALRHLCKKEAHAAERAVKGQGFDKWVVEFYPAHRVLAREMLAPVCEMFRSLGVPAYADELADLVCDDSIRILQAFYDTLTPAQLTEKLSQWPEARSRSYRKWASGLLLASRVEDGSAPQAPVVNITNEITVQPTPVENDITVNVPEQPTPSVTVTNQVATPDVKVESPVFVDVKVPEPKSKKVTFERDDRDQIVEARVEPEE